MITFHSVGHVASVALADAHKFLLGAEHVTAALASNKTVQAVVETITQQTLGIQAADLERTVFAVAGELQVLLTSVNSVDNAKKLADIGFDQSVIDQFKKVLSLIPKV